MATDRPTHPSSYPRTHWGLQLERDPSARISCLGMGGTCRRALRMFLSSGKESPRCISKQTAQNHLAYFFSCLGDSEIVSTRGSRDSEGEFLKNPSLWTCLANKALENCLPELSTCCCRNYHPPSGYAWLKSLILLPESCSHPQKACKGNDCVWNPTGHGIAFCALFAS